MDKVCYIYRHIRLDTNTPFYIGVGTHKKNSTCVSNMYKRAFNTSQRSEFWFNVTKKTNYRVDIVLDNISQEEAFEKEKEFISLYGRHEFGGVLVNLTNGGRGMAGKLSTPTERKIKGEAHRKKVIHTTTGEFVTAADVAKEYNVKSGTVNGWLNGGNKNPTLYCYYDRYLTGNFTIKEQKTPYNGKKVIDTNTLIVYDSIAKAAAILNIKASTLARYLSGSASNKTGMCYYEFYLDGKVNIYQERPKITEETRNKLRIVNKRGNNSNSKRVINIETGQVYETAKDVSELIGVNYVYLCEQLRGKRKNKTPFVYQNLDKK